MTLLFTLAQYQLCKQGLDLLSVHNDRPIADPCQLDWLAIQVFPIFGASGLWREAIGLVEFSDVLRSRFSRELICGAAAAPGALTNQCLTAVRAYVHAAAFKSARTMAGGFLSTPRSAEKSTPLLPTRNPSQREQAEA